MHKNKGVLKLNDLAHILKAEDYPESKHLFLIDMMKKFELCFEFTDNNPPTYLVPELLPKAEPKLNWNDKTSLAFQFHYDVLPHSIMSRFIVKMQQNIYKKTYWHTGVMLEYGKNKALIKADIEDKKMLIWVDGHEPTRRSFLSIIRHTFQLLHEHLPKINPKEKVPYKSEILDYEDLIICEEIGEETFLIPKLKERVNIKQLLDGIEEKREHREYHERPIPVTVQPNPTEQHAQTKMNRWMIAGVIAAILAALFALLALF